MHQDFEKITVSIKKGKIPSLPFLELKNDILGAEFELSISFVDQKTAQNINKKYRDKDYIPNTLSFPYGKNSGEIFLQLETIYNQAASEGEENKKYLLYILIHSLLHLKGHDHGKKMENLEKKYLQKYAII